MGAVSCLVVEPGDRVAAQGRYVRIAEADWLDLAQVSSLVLRSGVWKSNRSVRLIGVDVAAIPSARSDPTVIPGRLRVVGVWRDDVIYVEAQDAVPWPAHARGSLFASPAPPGGWDVGNQSTDLDGLEEMRASGLIARDGWVREAGGALVLRVAATDVPAVERALGAQLPRRLCVVRSRYTSAQLREVEDTFTAHSDEWGLEASSYHGMDAECQPFADVVLTRVSADLAAWADSLPEGLLTLHPAMTPA